MNQHFKTTWKQIRRAPYQSLAAVAVMTLTLFVLSVFTLVGSGSQAVMRYFETRPQVTAFLEDDLSPESVQMIQDKLISMEEVKEVRYVSKEEALEIYKEQNKDDPLLLEMVTASILPASLEVSTTDIAYLDQVAQELESEEGVEEVAFQRDVVAALQRWTNILRVAGIGLGGALVLVSFLIILIIVGMKVAISRGEIEALSLIGASNNYIRLPFLLEGVFYGLAGALFGWGLSYLLLLYATPFLLEFLTGVPLLPVPFLFMLIVLGGETLLGVLIGGAGSFLAVKRYFK